MSRMSIKGIEPIYVIWHILLSFNIYKDVYSTKDC